MSVISGKSGKLSLDNGSNQIGGVRNWKINRTASNPAGTPANAGAMQVVLPNQVTDWTMSAEFYGRELPCLPGTGYTFYGYTGADVASGSVLCESVTINCDIEAGGIISGTASFGANGALTLATGSAPTLGTGSTLTMFGGNGCKAAWQPIVAGTAGSIADIPGVRSWTLTISNRLNPYVEASTAGVTKRTAGVFSASGSFSMYQGDLAYFSTTATRMLAGDYGVLRLYVSSTLFFGLSYAVIGANDASVEIESGANNAVNIPFVYSGWANISGTMTQGALVRPDTTNFWP